MIKEELFTVNVYWAEHKEDCYWSYCKVITCFACGAQGKIEDK